MGFRCPIGPGVRVKLRPLPSIHASLHGAVGVVKDTEYQHEGGLQWMEFEKPIKHYTHGEMQGCWFGRAWVEILPE